MKTVSYRRNVLLAVFWGLLMAFCLMAKAFYPAGNLPTMDIPLLLLLSILSLLADHYLGRSTPCAPVVTAVVAALTFGLMPLCAGMADGVTALKIALGGGVTFAVAVLLFDSAMERLSDRPLGKAAPLMCAFGLFLAGQCFTNIFF